MNRWAPQHFEILAEKRQIDPQTISNALEIAQRIRVNSPGAQPIFSLKHLALCSGGSYNFLREVIERKEPEKYRVFQIRKKTRSKEGKIQKRNICVPSNELMMTQRWINANICKYGSTSKYSFAFKPGDSVYKAAEIHCNSRWILKIDISNFFESIDERKIYKVFRRMGYQPLVSFEMSRLCTKKTISTEYNSISTKKWTYNVEKYNSIRAYKTQNEVGHLPQGAPTSPMLSNLVMLPCDNEIADCAKQYGLNFSRYADDMTFSTSSKGFTRMQAEEAISRFFSILKRYGFVPNELKTQVVPPGARKVVLGLLVDGPTPRLTKEFRNRLRMHIHQIGPHGIGPARYAKKLQARSVFALMEHINGLIAFAKGIDPVYASWAQTQMKRVIWK